MQTKELELLIKRSIDVGKGWRDRTITELNLHERKLEAHKRAANIFD